MTKRRPPPIKVENREQQFEKLLAAMGLDDGDPFSRFALTGELDHIQGRYVEWIAASKGEPDRKLVHRYRDSITKLVMLSEAIGPDFLRNEIETAGWFRQNPDADEKSLHAALADRDHRQRDVVATLTRHGLDIDHWLKTSGEAYRKRMMRKLVVEPFLRVLIEYRITTSRRERPLKRMSDALFDWLGVEQKHRPSNAGINAIAAELAGAARSKSNANRRSKK